MCNTLATCPFCGGEDCQHFMGWTEDGRTIDPFRPRRHDDRIAREVQAADRIITTGVSARVYRDWVF